MVAGQTVMVSDGAPWSPHTVSLKQPATIDQFGDRGASSKNGTMPGLAVDKGVALTN